MASYFSEKTGVNIINSRIIVFINWSGGVLGKPKLPKHRYQEPRILGSIHCINKIYFHGTQCIDWLSFILLKKFTPVKCKIKPISGFTLGRLIYICRIHKTHQLTLINLLLGFGNILFPYNWMIFGIWKIY